MRASASVAIRQASGSVAARLGAEHHQDLPHVDRLSARGLLRVLLGVEALQVVLLEVHLGGDHGLHHLASLELALDLLAVFLVGDVVRGDARLELLDREAVLLRDPFDRLVDVRVARDQLGLLHHAREQVALDQLLERAGAHLRDLGLGRAGGLHLVRHRLRRAHHLGDQHDLAADLGGDAVDELLGGARGARGDERGDQDLEQTPAHGILPLGWGPGRGRRR